MVVMFAGIHSCTSFLIVFLIPHQWIPNHLTRQWQKPITFDANFVKFLSFSWLACKLKGANFCAIQMFTGGKKNIHLIGVSVKLFPCLGNSIFPDLCPWKRRSDLGHSFSMNIIVQIAKLPFANGRPQIQELSTVSFKNYVNVRPSGIFKVGICCPLGFHSSFGILFPSPQKVYQINPINI